MQAWKHVTLLEMKQCIGLMLVTGIIQKPDLKMYWTEDQVFETPVFFFSGEKKRLEIDLKASCHFSILVIVVSMKTVLTDYIKLGLYLKN
jgi:hypothetical protein